MSPKNKKNEQINNKQNTQQRYFVQIAIDPVEKEKWKNCVRKNDKYSNLTAFIKYITNAYMDGELVIVSENNPTDFFEFFNKIEGRLTEFMEERDKLLETMKDLRNLRIII